MRQRTCDVVFPQLKSEFKLYDHQRQTVDWIHATENEHGCLLAMNMGLGKTLVALTAILNSLQVQRARQLTSLYVCPVFLMENVLAEVRKFFTTAFRCRIWHHDYDLTNTQDTDLIVTSYCTLASQAKILQNSRFFRVIFDESHVLIHPRNKLYLVAKSLRAQYRLCMTGTPVHESFSDIIRQLAILGVNLERPYARWTEKRIREDPEIMRYIRFVKYKDASTIQLAMHTVYKVVLQLPPPARAEYDRVLAMRSSKRQARALRHISAAEALDGCVRLLKRVWGGSAEAKIVVFAKENHILHSARACVLEHWPHMADRNVLVSAERAIPRKTRAANVRRFQCTDSVDMLFISGQCGSLGLDLTAATILIFLQPMNSLIQALHRVVRPGQTKPVSVYVLYVTDTIDADQFEDILGGECVIEYYI